MNNTGTSEPRDFWDLPGDVAAIPHTPSSWWEPTVCSHVTAPINLHTQSGSDTSEAHPSCGACALGPLTHGQPVRRWPFVLVDQMATWQLQQMPYQPSHCAEAVAFSFPLPTRFLSTPRKGSLGLYSIKCFQLNYSLAWVNKIQRHFLLSDNM